MRKALAIDRLAEVRQDAARDKSRILLSGVPAVANRGRVEAILMITAVVLGFWGFQEVTPSESRWQLSQIWSSAFRTLQLLTTQFPNELPVDLPVQLQIARFAMPLFAVWFSVAALLRRYNRPLAAWAASLSRDHVVVIGDSRVPAALARAFRNAGKKVVVIASPPQGNEVSAMESTGARVVFGDARQVSILRRAAVHRASVVVAADDMGPDAIGMATSIAALTRGSRPGDAGDLVLLARLAQRELRPVLSTQIASAVRDSRVNLRLYMRERTIARSLLSRYPTDWGDTPEPRDLHVVIFGCGEMGTELLLQLARVAVPMPGRRCLVTVVDRQAGGLRDQLLAAYPGLTPCVDLAFVEAEVRPSAIMVSEVEKWFEQRMPATAIYVCCGDDRSNLSIAIGLRRASTRRQSLAPPLFLYQRAGYEVVNGLPEIHSNSLDALRIIPFGSIEEEADPFYLVDEEIDILAQLLHEHYLASQRRLGAAYATAAAVPWPELTESYRSATRAEADHVVAKLRLLKWHAVVPDAADAAAAATPVVDPGLLQEMASQEHERWCRERWLSGWVYDPQRNDAEQRHDRLLPYAQLTEQVREFDLTTIRELPDFLEGLGIAVRSDLRLGIWFEGRQSLSSDALTQKTRDAVARRSADQPSRRHLQLVLPLRSPDEQALVAAMSGHVDIGVDIAMIRAPGMSGGDIGPLVARNDARRHIAAADRAVVLTPAYTSERPSEVVSLSALCAICDEVLLICEEVEIGESIIHQVEAGQQRKIELVAIYY